MYINIISFLYRVRVLLESNRRYLHSYIVPIHNVLYIYYIRIIMT